MGFSLSSLQCAALWCGIAGGSTWGRHVQADLDAAQCVCVLGNGESCLFVLAFSKFGVSIRRNSRGGSTYWAGEGTHKS